jgi:arylsulfatase
MESGPWFPSGAELQKAIEAGEATEIGRSIYATLRPVEQLYFLPDDPLCFENVVGDDAHAQVLGTMRALLAAWTEQTGDTVPENPTPNRQAGLGENARNPDFAYREQPGEARNADEINHPGPIRVQPGN